MNRFVPVSYTVDHENYVKKHQQLTQLSPSHSEALHYPVCHGQSAPIREDVNRDREMTLKSESDVDFSHSVGSSAGN